MRAQFDRIVGALCAGREPVAVMAPLALMFVLAAMLWLSACAFLMMEPGA